jgi:hypothetical protein
MPWQQKTRSPLSHEEFLKYLPQDVRTGVYQWPLENLPLRQDAKIDAGLRRIRATGEGLIRVTGLVCISEREGLPWLSLKVGNNADFMTIGIGQVDSRIRQLKGLYVDTSIDCDPLDKDRPFFTSGTLEMVHGVEQPMRKGAGRGVVRGEVSELHEGALGGSTYGATLKAQSGDIHVQWNPRFSETIAQEGIAPGALALMAVVRQGDEGNHYMWHPNNDDARRVVLEPATIVNG